jgi:hypothetical protein
VRTLTPEVSVLASPGRERATRRCPPRHCLRSRTSLRRLLARSACPPHLGTALPGMVNQGRLCRPPCLAPTAQWRPAQPANYVQLRKRPLSVRHHSQRSAEFTHIPPQTRPVPEVSGLVCVHVWLSPDQDQPNVNATRRGSVRIVLNVRTRLVRNDLGDATANRSCTQSSADRPSTDSQRRLRPTLSATSIPPWPIPLRPEASPGPLAGPQVGLTGWRTP